MQTHVLGEEFATLFTLVLGYFREAKEAGTCGQFHLSVTLNDDGDTCWTLTEDNAPDRKFDLGGKDVVVKTPNSVLAQSNNLQDIVIWLKQFCSF